MANQSRSLFYDVNQNHIADKLIVQDLTVNNHLLVNGSTTTINSTVTTIDDPVITLGGDTAPTVNDSKDRGIEFRYHTGSNARIGFFGYDASTGYFAFYPNATNTNEVFTGVLGDIAATNFRGNIIGKLVTARTITLSGDVVGSVSFDGGTDVTIATTIQANSVALGVDTTGNYVASITNGSWILGANGGSESAALTLSVDATSANTASKIVARDGSGNFSAGTITASLNGNAASASELQTARTIALSGDVVGSVSFDGGTDVTIATTIQGNSIILGTDTTGNYVGAVAVSGNGLSLTGTAGEGVTFTVNSNATAANTASTIVFRDGSGNFSAGTITASLNGNASTASELLNPISLTIGSSTKLFDGSANVSWSLAEIGVPPSSSPTFTGTVSVPVGSATSPAIAFTGDSNTGIYSPGADQLAITVGGSQVALFTSDGITGDLIGNASTATKLATARLINGTSFDGSADITTAKWGTARSITIGSSTKSVDGSIAVSWSLAEIGVQSFELDNDLAAIAALTGTTGVLKKIAIDTWALDTNVAFTNLTNTFTVNQIISVNDNIDPALRITQTGTGNCLVVEDSANPDSTMFVIDASGGVRTAGSQSITVQPTANAFNTFSSFSVQGTTVSTTTREFLINFGLTSTTGSTATPQYNKDKVTLYTGIQAQNGTGDVWSFNPVTVLDAGSNVAYDYNAYIIEADLNNNVAHRGETAGPSGLAAPVVYGIGVTGAGSYRSTSGIIITGLTPSNTPIWNRGITFALDSIKQATIADYTSSVISLDLQGTHNKYISVTGALSPDAGNNSYAIIMQPTINSTVSGITTVFYSSPQTSSSGTITAIQHFSANNILENGTASVTAQYGFLSNNLTSAPGGSNFGFYSNVASPNWAFYGAGTASSYFGGGLYINYASPTLTLQDTDNRSAMIQCNANNFYILRGAGVNSITWESTGAGWPLVINLENNNATFGGDVTAFSDQRLKTNIVQLDNALDKLMAITGVYFNWIHDTDANRHVGIIAQDVERVYPELVGETDGKLTVCYDKLAAVIIEAIRELKFEVDGIKRKLN